MPDPFASSSFASPDSASPLLRHAAALAGARTSKQATMPSQQPAAAEAFGDADPTAQYAFQPDAPMIWDDWDPSSTFPDFSQLYEPQGELLRNEQQQQQQAPAADFSILQPVASPSLPAAQQQAAVATSNSLTGAPTASATSAATAPQQHTTTTSSSSSSSSSTASAMNNNHNHNNTPSLSNQNPLSPPPVPRMPQRPAIQTSMSGTKRKADSEPASANSVAVTFSSETPNPKRVTKSRSSSASEQTPTLTIPAQDSGRPSRGTDPSSRRSGHGNEFSQRGDANAMSENAGGGSNSSRQMDARQRRIPEMTKQCTGANVLPAGKVFPIQIGCELFRLSGASISSDAPSYFSHFFGEQLRNSAGRAGDVKTLYIDRDPVTFKDISLHLQGYHVKPRDNEHFVRLFADAQFYSLPRLTQQLFKSEIFVHIGNRPFQIPRDLFSSPGDSPNFFTLGFAHFFTTPQEVFPGLDRQALLRPPSILPPSIPGRSGEIFAELVRYMQGYPVHINNEAHRAELLRDARYFHFKGLEQRLIPCDIGFNRIRNMSEILIRLEDIRQSGVSFVSDTSASTSAAPSPISKPSTPTQVSQHIGTPSSTSVIPLGSGTVFYARPYTDDQAHGLVLEIGGDESTRLHLPSSALGLNASFSYAHTANSLELRATFANQTLARISSLFSVIASKMGLPATQPLGLMMLQSGGGVAAQPISPANSGISPERVRVRWEMDSYVEVDGVEARLDFTSSPHATSENQSSQQSPRIITSTTVVESTNTLWPIGSGSDHERDWVVRRAQWRLRVEPTADPQATSRLEVVMCIVKLDAFTTERVRNKDRGFLAGLELG